MTKDERDRLRALRAEAEEQSPGPWTFKDGDEGPKDAKGCLVLGCRCCADDDNRRAAVAAYNALPALLDELDAIEKELATAQHWRERHSETAEAYGAQSQANWKRARAWETVAMGERERCAAAVLATTMLAFDLQDRTRTIEFIAGNVLALNAPELPK